MIQTIFIVVPVTHGDLAVNCEEFFSALQLENKVNLLSYIYVFSWMPTQYIVPV